MKTILRICASGLALSLFLCGCGTHDQADTADMTDAPAAELPAERKAAVMQVNLDGETYEITDADSVTGIYETLDGYLYEVTDDASVNGMSLYFYDANGNQFKAYTLNDGYAKMDGLADTYRITDDDYDYRELVDEVESMIVN